MTGRTIKISGKALEKLRNSLALTQRELGEKIGLSERRISQIEREEPAGIFPPKFRKLAEGLGLTLEQLFLKIGDESLRQRQKDWESGTEFPKQLKQADDARKKRKRNGDQSQFDDRSIEPYSEQPMMAEVPMFDLSVAAGTWTDVSDVEGVMLTEDQIRQGLFRVRIAGDSMKPDYQSGEVIEFKCLRVAHEGPIEGADYYVQKNDGTATFKRMADIDEDSYTLVAVNTKKYNKPLIVSKQEVVRMARAVAKVTILELRK